MSIIRMAADLLGPAADDASVHPEYRRAIVELTAESLGLCSPELIGHVESAIEAVREGNR